MFGPGAPMMRQFYDELETIWVEKIAGGTVDTALGPVAQVPPDIDVWTKIYSPEKLKSFARLFDRAERAAAKTPDALKRIRFMRRHLLVPLLEGSARFENNRNAIGSWSSAVPGKVHLRPFRGEVNEVGTRVRITCDEKDLIFSFHCEEVRMKDLIAKETARDAAETYADSCVEIFLNPSGDRKHYFHLVVNANGALFDSANSVNEASDPKWNSSASVEVKKLPDAWEAVVKVPWQSLGEYDKTGFPVNFARHRALKGPRVGEVYYQWSPMPGRSFHALERYGKLVLKKERDTNLLADPDFRIEKLERYRTGAWSLWRSRERCIFLVPAM